MKLFDEKEDNSKRKSITINVSQNTLEVMKKLSFCNNDKLAKVISRLVDELAEDKGEVINIRYKNKLKEGTK